MLRAPSNKSIRSHETGTGIRQTIALAKASGLPHRPCGSGGPIHLTDIVPHSIHIQRQMPKLISNGRRCLHPALPARAREEYEIAKQIQRRNPV